MMKSLFALGLNLVCLSFYSLQASTAAKISYCDQAEEQKIVELGKIGAYKIGQGRLFKRSEGEKFKLVPNTFDLKKVINHRDELIALQCDGDLFHYDEQKNTWRKLKDNVFEVKSARGYLMAISQNSLYVATNLYLLQEDASIFRLVQNNVSDVDDSEEGLIFYDLQGEHQIVKTENGTLLIHDESIVIDDSASHYFYKVKSLRMLKSFEVNILGGENDLDIQVLDSKFQLKLSENLIGKKILLSGEQKKLLQIKSDGLALPFKVVVLEKDLWEAERLMNEFKLLKLDQANFINGKETLKVSNDSLEIEIEIFKR